MGDQLMKRVVRDWGDLPGNAYKALMVMASCAMDDGKPPVYFGGWERLALTGLGRREGWPADGDLGDPAERFRRSSEELVRRAVKCLVERGALKVRTRGRLGVRAEYELVLPQLNVGSLPRQSVAGEQQKVATQQRTVGAYSQQSSPQTQSAEPISPIGVRHQGAAPAVENHRLTDRERESARRRIDGEAVA